MHLMCVTDLSLLVSFSRCLDEDEKHLFSSEFLRVLPETFFADDRVLCTFLVT